ncbi:hypothetical protein LO80_04045 [Candidatus Francisella endociliophora]|uniref:GDSL family lipase n=1 Tax=Candidatus Francisella endociliophora TaxID=653937 RepID=A0A097ENT5_9GAMM|nr:SGNH/GDSL hydrolase family protein [Francisella sp. FSC1006]AIT09226.1 hypothetical protein LO80_04045 [Francisella sp. FSC1006]
MKISKIILAGLTTFTISTPILANDQYIIFGDSLTDTGSSKSSQILKDNDLPATNGGEIDGNNLIRDLGNNYWVPGDTAFPKNFQAAPITSFNYSDINQAPKTWINYFSEKNGQTLVIYRAAITDFGKYLNTPKNNITFATATAQSGDNFIDDLDYKAIYQTGMFPYADCPADKYGEVLKGSPIASCVPSVTKQVKKFIKLAKANDFKPTTDTKVIIWVGGNDVFGNIVKILNIPNIDVKNIKSEFKKFQPSLLVNNVKTSIKLLENFGIKPKNIYVFALPNFKYVPAVHQLISEFPNSVQTVISSILSAVSINYNNSLRSMANHEGANFFDVGKYLIELVKDPQNPEYEQYFGKVNNNPFSMCVDTITTPSKNMEENFPICKGYIFYNKMHPTTYTHNIVADKFQEFVNTYSLDKK